MNIKRILESVGFTVLVCVSSFFPVVASAQQVAESDDAPIKIVNRDGEAVDSTELGDGIEIEGTKPADSGAQDRGRRVGAAAKIGNGTGKITIIDGEGKKQEIDIRGARSVLLRQSSKTVVQDGVQKLESVGKAVVVDALGKRHEYELAPQDPAVAGGADGPIPRFPTFRGTFQAKQSTNNFMIGVSCKPVSELLTSHLRLEPNTGLAVQSVRKDSPAAKAGIKKHDILMYAEDRELSKISDLNEVVNKAGKQNAEVPLTIIRGGKEIGISVGVVARPEPANNPIAGFPEIRGLDFELRQGLTDGIIIDRSFDLPSFEALDVLIPEKRELSKEMEQMGREFDELRLRGFQPIR